jgi:hypothetical protein
MTRGAVTGAGGGEGETWAALKAAGRAETKPAACSHTGHAAILVVTVLGCRARYRTEAQRWVRGGGVKGDTTGTRGTQGDCQEPT